MNENMDSSNTMNHDDTMNGNSSSNGTISGSGNSSGGDKNSNNNSNNNINSKSSSISPIKDNNIGVKRQLDNEKSPNGNTISSSGRERKPVVPYAPETTQRTPSAKRQKSSIDAKAKKEEERKAAAAKLKAEAKTKAKAEEKKATPKFPMKDEEVDKYDKTLGKERVKIPEPTTKINSSFADDIVGVWDFLNTFKTQLSLPSIEIDDFIEMMEYTSKESVALTEVFLAPLRIILLDNAYVSKVSAALPKGLSFCRKPDSQKEIYIQENLNQKLPVFSIKSIVNKDDGSVDKLVSEGFDSAFNGLRLLPRKLSASLICDPLMWQTVLRAILLRDPSVRDLRNDIFKLFVEYDSVKRAVNGSKKKSKDEEGGIEEYESCVKDLNKYAALPIGSREEKKNKGNLLNHDLFLRLNSDPFSVLEHLIAAAQALETKELHELSFRHKISILKVLCDACFETEEIRELLAKNIEERASLITANRKRLEEKKKEQREIANCKRDDAIKLCWQANKLAADAKAVKSKKKPAAEAPTAASPSKKSASPSKKSGGSKNKNDTEVPNKKDPLYPKQDQLNAMIEELALLDSLNIDKVIDNIEVEDVSDDEDDDDLARLEFTDDGPKQKSRASIRSKAGEKKTARQEKKARNFNIENANIAINRALETHAEKDIKAAIKLAQKAGFEGEDDDGNVFCTQLLKQIFKLRYELELKSAEEAENYKQDKDMAGLVCRSEPIGKDRHFNEYWAFKGDERLFVRSKVSDKSGEKDKLTTIATSVAAANPILQKLYNKRPFEKTYQWGMFAAESEMWEIYQSLDERGERESALKAALKARFVLTPPPAEFLKTGSEYIGKSVSRSFGKKKKITIGKIVGWLPPLDGDPALWHILHPDGDEEDLEEHELLAALISDEEAARSSSSAMSISSAPIKIDSKADKNAPPNNNEMMDVPDLVKAFRNSASRNHQKIKDAQLGIAGLKFEIIRAHNVLADSLKNTKQWVRSVQEATTLKELRGLLKELELMVYGLQQGVPDVDDDEEEEREKNKDREEMKKTGWDFENDAYINKRIRRFFPGQPKSDGTIIAYLSADKNDGEKWWRCVYDDHDEEDLAEDTVILGIRHFEENAFEDDTIVPDDNVEDEDESENEALPIENLDDGDDEVYHPQELVDKITGKSNHLWPTKGVRKRWIDAVDKSNTIGEVALSLSSLLEYSKEFCDCKIDQCEGTQRPTTSIYGTNRIVGTNKSSKKRKANDDDFHDNGRQQRAAAKRVINYAE